MRIASEGELLEIVHTTIPDAERVMVFAPHPDDEVFGCGGTLCLLHDAGARITIHVLTDGALGGSSEVSDLVAVRQQESCAAAAALGLPSPVFWELPDRGLHYGEALIERITRAVQECAADLVFLPAAGELHPDHQVLALAGIEALRRLGGSRQVAFYEVGTAQPCPNLLLDISTVAEHKKRAMSCFTSQLAEQPYDKRIIGLNQYRAYTLGATVLAAEAFRLLPAQELSGGIGQLMDGPAAHRRRRGYVSIPDDLPLISIIIRSMDRPTLDEALDSLALQTYPHLEVLVVNAKGGVHCQLDGHCGPFPLRLLNQDGGALQRSAAANLGLQEAQGRYLGFLDDDDILLPDHLHSLVTALQSAPTESVAYAAVQGARRTQPDTVITTFAEPEVTFARLLLGNVIPIHAVLFPAALYEQGAQFDESLDCYEDWDFWLQLSRQVPFVFVDRVTATYYLGGSSEVSPLEPNNEAVRQAACTLFEKWLRKLTPSEMKAVADYHHQTCYDLNVKLQHTQGDLGRSEAQRTDLENQLEHARRQLQYTEEGLAGSETQRADLERQLEHARRQLQYTEEGLAGSETQRAELERQLGHVRCQLQHTEQQLTVCRTEEQRQREALHAVYTSRSWLLTRPVRWCGHTARTMRAALREGLRRVYWWLPLTETQRAKIRGWYYRYPVVNLAPGVSASPHPAAGEQPVAPFTRAAMASAPIRILLIERSVPRPNQDAGSMMIYSYIRVFREQGYAVTFFPADLAYDPLYTPALQALGVTCLHLPLVNSLYEHLVDAGTIYNYILSCRPDFTVAVMPLLRTHCPRARILYETHDLHYVRQERQAELEQNEELRNDLLKHARWRKEQELGLVQTVDCTIVVSEQERITLLHEVPEAYVEVIPVVSETRTSTSGYRDREDLVFIGGYEHRPNVDAALYFVREILPLVLAQAPEIRFHLVGSNAPPEITGLAGDQVIVHGFVPDLDELMNQVRISVNPLRFGAGVKGKMITSMFYGVPCIGTSIAVEGMGVVPEQQALVADTPQEFAAAVLRLYRDQELWERLSAAGRALVQQHFSLEAANRGFKRIFAAFSEEQPCNDLCLERVVSHEAWLQADRQREQQRRQEIEATLTIGGEPFQSRGSCFVCDTEVSFHSDLQYGFPLSDGTILPNWRERVVCPLCGLNNRMRATIHLFHLLCAPTPGCSLYLTEQTTALFAWFKEQYSDVVGSEFLGDGVPAGATNSNGIRNENLTALSFSDNRLDAILSFDVIEHIPDYLQAFRECLRCLKPGGTLFFTVPFAHAERQHIVRAELDKDGAVHHLLPPEYHGDPINNDGCLCFYHFGWELLDQLRALGFSDVAAYFYWSQQFGYLGGDQLLFKATKPPC